MKGWLTSFLMIMAFMAQAQMPVFEGQMVKEKTANPKLSSHFYDYDIFSIHANSLHDALKADDNDLELRLQIGDKHDWSMYLYPSYLRRDGYVLRQATSDGVEALEPDMEIKAFRGELTGGDAGSVRLTIDDHFLYGTIIQNGQLHLIEPLSYFVDNAPKDQYVIYAAEDVIPYEGNACGVTEMQEQKHKHEHGVEEMKINGLCYEVELSIASDGLMFNSYGSVAAVENHNIGVMNNVAGNWDDEFNDEIQFLIVEQFVSTSPANDPWTASTNAGTLLGDFSNWGPGGFSQTHDLGSLWTDRNFNGGTIGIAWLSSVCTGNRYHCLQDFSNNAEFLRVLTSHEIGHNFSATHDASGTWIMSPTVNTATQWSNNSQNQINGYYPGRPCLSLCPPPTPPVPLFSSNINNLCVGSMVTFYDESLFSPNSWSWSFPGATPASSSDQNPTVTYPNPGVYSVSLTVSNANGSSSTTQNGFIVVGGSGTDFFFRTDFETGPDGWTIENPDGQETWTNVAVGGSLEGVRAMKMDNFNYNAQGERDGLISPQIDLTGRTNAELQIDYAYRRYNSNFRDSMVVYISTNGGATFPDRIYAATENGGGNFATAPDSQSDFTPNDSEDYCFDGTFGNACLSLDLSQYADVQDLRVKIENVNGFGNNMYIDNVRVLSSCQVLLPPVAAFEGSPTSGCAPLLVNFSDLSENNPISWNWQFPGGIPAVSNQQNPTIAYTTPGVYNVTLTVVNLAGTSTTTEVAYVNAFGPPQADFDSDINGTDVDFTDLTTGTVNTYLWSFGDGDTSTEANPSHTYDGDGTYLVSLTVTGPCGTNTYQTSITIATPPIPAFSSNVTSGCEPLAVQFFDQSSPNTTSWNWQFPGGNPATSTDQNPLVIYDTPGTYDVILTASNATGSNTITQTAYVTVDEVAVAGFTAAVNGYDVSFTNTSSASTMFDWDFGDGVGTSTAASPDYTYSSDGTYTVVLTAENGCGIDTFEMDIEISNLPVPDFSSDVTAGCAPLTVQFFDESSANTDSWSWNFPGGTPSTSTDQNPVVVYSNAGTYNVILTVTNSAGSNTITLTNYITVDELPVADFSTSISDLTVDITNNTSNADSFSWDFGDGVGTSAESDPGYTYTEDGTYTITLTATNDCGSVTETETITVSTMPIPGFSADATSGCAPFTVQFTDESSGNTTSWSWTFEDGNPATSNDQNPLVTWNTPGTYNVTLTVTNAAGSNTITETDYIVVTDVPEIDFVTALSGADLSTTNNTTGATEYLWDFGDGMGTSTDFEPGYTYTEDGTYTITLDATNDCGTVTLTETVTVVTPPAAGIEFDAGTGCAPLTVQFMDASSTNAANWNWSFPGGNPATSTDQNPVVVYNTAGTYNVSLEVSNAAGTDVITLTDVIVVSDVPTIDFSVSANGLSVDVTNNTTGATEYLWDFGDGMGTSTDFEPGYTYTEDGTYTISLDATNDCGTVTMTETVTVATAPTAGIEFDAGTGCAPLTVQFMDASSTNAANWNWSFPGGNPAISTDQNPVVVYNTAGTYSVTLEVSNAAGTDVITLTDVIVVSDVPTIDFSVSANGLSVDVTNNTTGATEYLWDFGDGMGTSTNFEPGYTYTEDGTYTITLDATNDCGTVSMTETVTVVTAPQAGFAANVTEGCVPMTVQFTNQSTANAETFEWSFPGGMPASSTDENPIVVYNNAGMFDVSLTVTNAAGESTVQEVSYISVGDVPVVGFNNNINGADVDFENTSNGATSYVWEFGDGESSEEVNPSYTYDEDGIYMVTLTATNDCGSVTTQQTIVIATAGPVALFSSGVYTGCLPLEVEFSNQSSANTESIEWIFEGGLPATSTDENPVVTYNSPGEFDVTIIATNINGADTLTLNDYVSVLPDPEADFDTDVMGSTVDFDNLSQNALSYTWYFGDGETSNEENPTYVYDNLGNFMVVLVAENTCGTDTAEIVVNIQAIIPQASFSANTQNGCAPFTVQFMDESEGDPTSWEWTFQGGDPATSTEQNPEVTFNMPGTYNVSLTVSNQAGENMIVQSGFITVIDVPSASFDFEAMDYDVVFENTSSGGTSYSWDFGDATGSSNPSPTHTYEEDGTYTVVLTVTNECGTSTFEQEIVIDVTSIGEIEYLNRFELYPNPNDGRFEVLMEGRPGMYDEIQLELYNVLGQQLYLSNADFSLGRMQQQIDVPELAKGVYFLRVRAGEHSLVREVVVQ
ncbi:MAG: PKD domain-containing protein [Bacteroidetes bacterium]|nr:PKD domain-containing protein [Bacteroidota bacterium]